MTTLNFLQTFPTPYRPDLWTSEKSGEGKKKSEVTIFKHRIKTQARTLFLIIAVKHRRARVARSITGSGGRAVLHSPARVRLLALMDGQRPSLVTLEIIVSIFEAAVLFMSDNIAESLMFISI